MNPNPAHDPAVASLIRKATRRGLVAGAVLIGLLAAFLALGVAGFAHEFRQGAIWGFGIGLGIVLGGTVLNALIGLLDQVKSDLTGS